MRTISIALILVINVTERLAEIDHHRAQALLVVIIRPGIKQMLVGIDRLRVQAMLVVHDRFRAKAELMGVFRHRAKLYALVVDSLHGVNIVRSTQTGDKIAICHPILILTTRTTTMTSKPSTQSAKDNSSSNLVT